MATSVIRVDGMSCEHCVKAVSDAVNALGVQNVAVDLAAKTVTVDHDEAAVPVDAIKSAIDGQGFDVIG